MNEWVDMECSEKVRAMNLNPVSLFVLARLELALFITEGSQANSLAAGWGHSKMMCSPKAARLGHEGLNGPVTKSRA